MLRCGGRLAIHQNDIGEIVGGHRVHARVELIATLLVAAGADDGELGLGHAGLDRSDSDARAVKIRAQRSSENWRTNAFVPP